MPDRYGDTDAPGDDVLWDAERRRLAAIASCDLCNVDGIRGDLTRCDHGAREQAMNEIRRILRKDAS